jgi:hypothetical protein
LAVSTSFACVLSFAMALLCASTVALAQAASAPAGVQVWSSDINDSDFGGPGGGAASISIVCARNGAASGRVTVGAAAPIVGLKATMSDLKSASADAAVIPAGGIKVRYAVEWDGGISLAWSGTPGPDILLESPRPTFGPVQARKPALPVMVPVWVTVRVPKDAKAGDYTGLLAIEAGGSKVASVPVKLSVPDWALPDAQDHRAWLEVIEQPDTLAAEYKAPLWSDKHWEMVAKSLELIGPTGSRVVNVPLIGHTNYGSEDSMVRWIKRADGNYDYDFSLMDKYLDLAQKQMGKPKLVLFNVWDVYLMLVKQTTTQEVKFVENTYEWREATRANLLAARKGKGPLVTVLDPASGKTEQVAMPRYEDPSSKALWQPLWDAIRARMKARGLESAMMLAQVSDIWPTQGEVEFWNGVTGGLTWSSTSHHAGWVPTKVVPKPQMPGNGMIGYTTVCFDYEWVLNPAKDRRYGWKSPFLGVEYCRFSYLNSPGWSAIRHEVEVNITGAQRGLGHVGGDFWPCLRAKNGTRNATVTDRFPESYWHSLNTMSFVLAPGPTGPVGTARLEIITEGVQECEARIAIEAALTDAALKAKLGDDLAKRAGDTLDERQLAIWKARGTTDDDFQKFGVIKLNSMSNGIDLDKKWGPTRAAGQKWFCDTWKDRTAKLYAVAGEVEKKLAEK